MLLQICIKLIVAIFLKYILDSKLFGDNPCTLRQQLRCHLVSWQIFANQLFIWFIFPNIPLICDEIFYGWREINIDINEWRSFSHTWFTNILPYLVNTNNTAYGSDKRSYRISLCLCSYFRNDSHISFLQSFLITVQ